MPDPAAADSHHQPLADPNATRLRELAKLAKRVRDLEHQLRVARGQLDSHLHRGHQDHSITALANATGLSRETVYKAIGRHRATRA